MARLGDLTNIKTGKLDANASSESGQYPFFTCAVEPLKIDSYSYDCECVLVAGNGDLNVKYYNGKFDAYQRTYIIESKDKATLHVPYLYYFLDLYVEELRKQAIGGVIKYIKLGNLTEAQIPLPSLAKQKNIVETLNKSYHLVSLRKKQLQKLDDLVKARFMEMFGEPNTESAKYATTPLGELTICFDSRRKPVKEGERKSMQGPYPYYGATGIVDHVNDYRLDGTFLLVSEDGKALEFRNYDIAFIASGKIWVNNHAHVLQCKPVLNMLFLQYYIKYMDISHWVTGIDQKKLNRENMDTIPVMVPPIEIQEEYANLIQQTDKSKLSIQQGLEKLKTLKKSLMQQYFG